jgi:hypothetical protein
VVPLIIANTYQTGKWKQRKPRSFAKMF